MEGYPGKWSREFLTSCSVILNASTVGENKYSLLEKIQPLLSRPTFTYPSNSDRKQTNDALLKLWSFLLEVVDIIPYSRKPLFYRSMAYIMQRKEFALERFFSKGTRRTSTSSTSSTVASDEEEDTIREYRGVLMLTFKHAAAKMRGEFRSPIHQLFAAQVYAVSFFRLPSVGIAIVDAIHSSESNYHWKDIPPVSEEGVVGGEGEGDESRAHMDHRRDGASSPEPMAQVSPSAMRNAVDALSKRYTNSYENDSTDTDFVNRNPSIFQWAYFYEEEDKLLWEDLAWTEKLTERGDFFFTFLRLYAEHIEFTISKRPIAWHLLPGYNLFLLSFMKQLTALMFDMRISGYNKKGERADLWPESLKCSLLDCSATFLDNPQLLNLYIKLAFETCNSYSCDAVEFCLRCIELWFDTCRRSPTQSTTMIYNAFPNGMDEVVDIDPKMEPHYLAEAMMAPEIDGGLDIGIRTVGDVSHRQCFTGSDAVKWIVSTGITSSKADAKRACSRMLFVGLIKHVDSKSDADDFALHSVFRFTAHERSGFRYSEESEHSLPQKFNVDFFVKGFQILLDSEHFQILLRTLSFLYNQIDLMHGHVRLNIVLELLLKKNFYKLFLHWCFMVRKFFHHILVFKLFRTRWSSLPCTHSKLLLSKRRESMSTTTTTLSPEYLSSLTSRVGMSASLAQGVVAGNSKSGGPLSALSNWFFGGTGNTQQGVFHNEGGRDGEDGGHTDVFSKSLDHEQQALDLVLASKLDSYIYIMGLPNAGQILKESFSSEHQTCDASIYISTAIKEYTDVLYIYFDIAKRSPGGKVITPPIDFNCVKMSLE